MGDPFLAEIRAFPFFFAPRGWARCAGQLLPVSQHQALFSLIGTVYGGDGRKNFALPDLRGASAMHRGKGPGLSSRRIGEAGGSAQVTLAAEQMPAHVHSALISTAAATSPGPEGRLLARGQGIAAYASVYDRTELASQAIGAVGGSRPHNNMQPFTAVSFCIALEGDYPVRA